MAQKRGRSWSDQGSRERQRRVEERASVKEQRESYKIERIRRLVEQGFTEDDLDDRRERYYCMKEHPGRFCRLCNPRADGDDNEGLSDEEAEISSSWSDGSASSDGDSSLTYSEIWRTEGEERRVVQYMEDKIKVVESITTQLKAVVNDQPTEKPPIGGLKGEWTLYNLDVCPKQYEPHGEYYRLIVSEAAIKGELLGHDIRSWPHKTFIEWSIKDNDGDIMPFTLPTHASLEPVPIKLMISTDDVPAEIVFLGNDCLWIRVPESIVYPNKNNSQPQSSQTIEFAGIRTTEADIERNRQRRLEETRKAHSPRAPIAASMCRWN